VPSKNPITRNYVVGGRNSRHVVKRRETGASPAMVREAMMARALLDRAVPVPPTVPSDAGAMAVEHAGFAWSVQPFLPGGPFSGRGGEVESTAAVLGRLQSALADVATDLFKDAMDPPNVLEELEGLVDEIVNGRTDPSREQLLAAQDSLLDAVAKAKSVRLALFGTLAPLHLDFHPLNLLMDDERVVAVLDLEDIGVYALQAGIGFAAFKLLRRRAVDAPQEVPLLADRWLRALANEAPALSFSAPQLAAGARHRVLVLIRLILHHHVRLGDGSLMYDLSKQLGSLREIEVLFERGTTS
jgi:Ser/Thr protein kinase RdoA (MazF antagonist)